MILNMPTIWSNIDGNLSLVLAYGCLLWFLAVSRESAGNQKMDHSIMRSRTIHSVGKLYITKN